MRNRLVRLAGVVALACLLYPGLLIAETGDVQPTLAPPASSVQSGTPVEPAALAPDLIAALFPEAIPASYTCVQARRDCNNYCWLNSCVVGTFSCDSANPTDYVCICQC